MLIKKQILFILLVNLLILCSHTEAEEISINNEKVFLPSLQKYFDLSDSSDPDFPTFGLSYINAKPYAIFGSNIGLYGSYSDNFNTTIFLSTFLELYNFSTVFIPWELWRGSLGVKSYFEYPEFNKKITSLDDRFIIELGIVHESDHYSTESYKDTFTTESYFDNGNFSSFEYFDVKLFYSVLLSNDLNLTMGIGDKYFIRSSARNLTYAYNIESFAKYNITNNIGVFTSCYYENIKNNLISSSYGFRIQADNQPLEYFIVRIGIDFIGQNNSVLQPYWVYTFSNGRGLNFLEKINAGGLGIRIVLSY